MNIIKFKDTIVSDLEDKNIQNWFNAKLRDRYAYNIHYQYIIPIENISSIKYIEFEKDIDSMYAYINQKCNYYKLVDDHYERIITPTSSQKNQAVVVYPYPTTVNNNSPIIIKVPDIIYIDIEDNEWLIDENCIDWVITNALNDVEKYRVYNDYVPDDDITLDELKQFRTWFAKSLLSFGFKYYKLKPNKDGDPVIDENLYVDDLLYDWSYQEVSNLPQDLKYNAIEVPAIPPKVSRMSPHFIKIKSNSILPFTDEDYSMLKYYANGMFDDNISVLIGTQNVSVTTEQQTPTACGCKPTNISSLYNQSVVNCNPTNIYRSKMKTIMIDLFTNLNVWDSLPKTFLEEFNKYVRGIIKSNLDLSFEDIDFVFGCDCLKSNTVQAYNQHILEQLVDNIDYIIKDGSSDGHKSSIYNALDIWATNLYEHMQWN